MRVQFQWTQRDWTEAVSLANQRAEGRKASIPGMTWALIVIPIVGAGGELLGNLRSRNLSKADLMLPVLLLVFTVLVAVSLLIARRQRIYKMLQQAAMPEADCEAILQESGWSVRELASSSGKEALLPWSDLRETRRGRRVLVLLQTDRFEALPLSSLTPDQDGHVRRLLGRKLRPSVT